MKKLLLALLLMPFATLLKAQDGVFMTYEDFKNNKIVANDKEARMDYNFGTNGYVEIKQGGKKHKYKLDEIYGFRQDDECWRTFQGKGLKDGMAIIEETGNYVYYITRIKVAHNDAISSGGRESNWEGSCIHYYISKDLNSPVYEFSAHIETLEDIMDAHKEFADLKPYLNKAQKRDRAEEILQTCIKHSPEYKIEVLPKSKK